MELENTFYETVSDCSHAVTMRALVEDLSCESLYAHSVVKEYYYYSGYTGSTGPRGVNGGICFYITFVDGGFKSNHTFGLNPDFHLVRGFTYYFKIVADGHPFCISTDTTCHPYPPVLNNEVDAGCMTLTVPLDAPDMLYYVSDAIYGTIYIGDAGPGPTGPTGIQGPVGPEGGPTGATGPPGPSEIPTFLSVSTTTKQTVLSGYPVVFETSTAQSGSANFVANTSAIYVNKPGFYLFHMKAQPIEGCQFVLYKNATTWIPESAVGTISGGGQLVNSFISPITDADMVNATCKLEMVNVTSYVPSVTLYDASSIGYTLPQVNASLSLIFVGPSQI